MLQFSTLAGTPGTGWIDLGFVDLNWSKMQHCMTGLLSCKAVLHLWGFNILYLANIVTS